MAKKAMPKILMLSAVMMVATGSFLGGFAAHAEPGRLGIVPETRGTASTVIPAHEPAMVGYQCVWFKGCKYCRACVECQWMLQCCKKRH